MRAFACRLCGQLVFFENTACLRCGADLGFWWNTRDLLTLGPSARYARCANSEIAACNWLVGHAGELCRSCELTRTRPADEDPDGLEKLAAAERAKRRLLFELGELGLPVVSWQEHEHGLGFDLLSSEHQGVITGHADGMVTIDLAETDAVHREEVRHQLGEPYRTMLGHFRHEIGHYYWPLLAAEGPARERCRSVFGDERSDYAAAVERHYESGPPADWQERHVSAYATMHPWEDWAETFAHYLHIRDTLQTASAYRVEIGGERVPASSDPAGFGDLLADWLPLTVALNAINRSMGRDDLYPFVLSEIVIGKLTLIHELLSDGRDQVPS